MYCFALVPASGPVRVGSHCSPAFCQGIANPGTLSRCWSAVMPVLTLLSPRSYWVSAVSVVCRLNMR